MGFTKATSDYLDAGGIIKWITTPKTSAFTAVSGEGYLVDTASAAITVTLPTSPSEGDEIIITDYASNAGTNNITLDPGTLNLRGATDDFVMSTNNQSVHLLYSGATKGWLVTSDAGAGAAAAAVPDLTVDYLVVAGGGGGGGVGGGGGAGGYRTSFSEQNVSGLSLLESTNYTVTIGAGGGPSATSAPWNNDGGIGANGGNSIFATITSAGGGGGAGATNNAGSGGSGGGTRSGTPGSGNTPSVTPSQGNSGSAINSGNPGYGGGGGGADEAGDTDGHGHGGDGKANSITGTSTYYAGGGTGGGNGSNGGLGGGAAAGANAGTANTGGGGGGGTWTNNANITTQGGGAGGSGIVILRYPDYYDIAVGSGLTTGTLNTAVGSGEKYTTFTAGTGNITFGAA